MDRTTETIGKEIQALRETIQRLEEEHQTYAGALEKAGDERKKVAFAAHGDKDTKAKERLTRARTVQRDAEFALEDLDSALAEAQGKFKTLEAERLAAYQQEKRAELEKKIAAKIERDKAAEPHISALVGIVERSKQDDREIVATAKEAGYENAPRFYSAKFLSHVVDARILGRNYRNMGFVRDPFLERPLAEIMAEFFANLMNGNGANGLEGSGADEPEAQTEVGAEATV